MHALMQVKDLMRERNEMQAVVCSLMVRVASCSFARVCVSLLLQA
jgi:hypothetical protein